MNAGERRDWSLGEFHGADSIAVRPPAFAGPLRPLPGQRLGLPDGEAHGGAPAQPGEVDATGDLADSACIRKSLRSDSLERTSGPCAARVSRGCRPVSGERAASAAIPELSCSSACEIRVECGLQGACLIFDPRGPTSG